MRPLKFLTDLPWWSGLPIFRAGTALIGFPRFFLAMLIHARFSLETPGLDLLNGLSSTATYGIRSAFSLATAFIAFRSFR